jgi:hypothetical protein
MIRESFMKLRWQSYMHSICMHCVAQQGHYVLPQRGYPMDDPQLVATAVYVPAPGDLCTHVALVVKSPLKVCSSSPNHYMLFVAS